MSLLAAGEIKVYCTDMTSQGKIIRLLHPILLQLLSSELTNLLTGKTVATAPMRRVHTCVPVYPCTCVPVQHLTRSERILRAQRLPSMSCAYYRNRAAA
jgi:hypothetical protein